MNELRPKTRRGAGDDMEFLPFKKVCRDCGKTIAMNLNRWEIRNLGRDGLQPFIADNPDNRAVCPHFGPLDEVPAREPKILVPGRVYSTRTVDDQNHLRDREQFENDNKPSHKDFAMMKHTLWDQLRY